jgi:hypothetical protein
MALSLLALVALAGTLGLIAGLRSAPMDPAAAIERAGYLWTEAGGRLEDCAAAPEGGAILVRCDGAAGAAVYEITRGGVRRRAEG